MANTNNTKDTSNANIASITPLTPTQEGILYHYIQGNSQNEARNGAVSDGAAAGPATPGRATAGQAKAPSRAYHQQFTADFHQQLDPERLHRAWQLVSDRAPALRTLITWERRDQPLQVARKQLDIQWQSHDWRLMSPQEQETSWSQSLEEDRNKGFDLGEAPLSRFNLTQLQDNRWRLMWSFHHIVLDGWSMRLLLDAAFATYDRLESDPAISNSSLDGHSGTAAHRADADTADPLAGAADFGAYVRHLANLDQTLAQAYWKQKFAQLDAVERPFFLQSGHNSRQNAGSPIEHTRHLGTATTSALQHQCRSHQVTLSTALTAAWGLLLGRTQRANESVFGLTVTTRPAAINGIEKTAGLFIHTIPAVVPVDPDWSVGAWLGNLQRDLAESRTHAHVPLSTIARLAGRQTASELFETLLVVENLDATGTPARGLRPTDTRYHEYSHYPLAILAVPGEDLELIAVADSARVPSHLVEQLLALLCQLLEAISTSPHARLGDFHLNAQETSNPGGDTQRVAQSSMNASHQPLASKSSGCDDVSNRTTAHKKRHVLPLFEDLAVTQPDRLALVAADLSMTYDQLNRAANTLAHTLRKRSGGSPGHVAVLIDRSATAIVAILAVLKAGGNYTPVDPAYPSERNAHILDSLADTGGRWLLVSPDRQPDIRSASLARWQTLPVELDSTIDPPADAETWPLDEQDLAYVMFTSGSTGLPKGVQVTHTNLFLSTQARSEFYQEAPASFLLLSSLATDSSVAGLFWTLTTGGTLVLPGPGVARDVVELARLVQKFEVSHTLCVPALYEILLEHLDAQEHSSLSTVIVAAEACPPSVVATHADRLPATRLFNEYGPTEATVWATAAVLADQGNTLPVSIGRPVGGNRIYLLDHTGQIAPAGWPGEIAIAGPGVARGYLNVPGTPDARSNPVRTAFSRALDGSALYRTGDLARMDSAGNLHLIGRIDNQIKVRGFRVEPAEIEQALGEHPGVTEVAVVLHTPQHPPVDTICRALLDSSQGSEMLARIQAMTSEQIDTELASLESRLPTDEWSPE